MKNETIITMFRLHLYGLSPHSNTHDIPASEIVSIEPHENDYNKSFMVLTIHKAQFRCVKMAKIS